MENIVWVVALVLGYAFLVNRSDLEKATGFIFGLLFATVIALLLGGSSIVSQIGWVAVCQFAWTLFHGVHVGFKRFRNTLVVAISITVVLSAAFLLKVSSPPGFLTVAAMLLVARWFVGLEGIKSKADQSAGDSSGSAARARPDGNFMHNIILRLDRLVERHSRWAQVQLWPRVRDRKNRRVLAALFACTFFLTTWHGTGGLLVVPEGNIALVRDSAGLFESRKLEPGVRAVIPYFEHMVLVSMEPVILPKRGSELLLSGKTSDGFKVTVQLEVSLRLSSEIEQLVPFYSGKFRGDPLPEVRAALELAFRDYLKTAGLQNFLPVVGRPLDIESALLPLAQKNLASGQPALSLEGVTIKRVWNEPGLQVPIDALRTARDAVGQLGKSIENSACQGNPNCR